MMRRFLRTAGIFACDFYRAMGNPETFRVALRDLLIGSAIALYVLACVALAQAIER